MSDKKAIRRHWGREIVDWVYEWETGGGPGKRNFANTRFLRAQIIIVVGSVAFEQMYNDIADKVVFYARRCQLFHHDSDKRDALSCWKWIQSYERRLRSRELRFSCVGGRTVAMEAVRKYKNARFVLNENNWTERDSGTIVESL